MLPELAPRSSGTWPSLDFRSSPPSEPAAREIRSECQQAFLMSQRFIPQTSLISIGATLPRNMEARKEDTREIREVSR